MRFRTLLQSITYQKKGVIYAQAQIIYNVISETQNYHKFIPWCSSSRIIDKISQHENKTSLQISFGKQFRNIQYVSHVKLTPFNNSSSQAQIHSVCRQKPLKYLDSLWTIKKENETKAYIQYKLDFSFQSIAFQLASSAVSRVLGSQMWNIFQKQSEKRHQYEKQFKLQKKKLLQQQVSNNISVDYTHNLADFLNKHFQYKTLYENNLSVRKKILELDLRIKGTENYEQKMQHELQNFLIYR